MIKLKGTLRGIGKVRFSPERRRLFKIAAVGILGANISSSSKRSSAAISGQKENTSNVKLAAMDRYARFDDQLEENLTLIKQLGLKYVIVSASGETATYETLLKMRQTIESAGLKVANIGMRTDHTIILNLPGRDEKVEAHRDFLRNAGNADYHTVWNHYSGSSIWSTGREVIRSASGRAFDMEKARRDGCRMRNGETWYPDHPTHGRVYSEQEIWDNWTHFVKAIVPVAEEAGVRIAFHPDDPPVPELGGVPRIFSSFESYKRAFEITNSPNVGIYLCVGCWLEGGKLMGKNVLETIRYFGERNRIFKVDFRNVSAPLPHFVETFPDNGYMDMYKVMRALVEVNNHCVVCDDHVPETIGGHRIADAYAIGYMRALLERANEEVKESDRLHFKGPYSS
jgi:mannonate dehydratase